MLDPKCNLTPVEGFGDVPVKLYLKNGKEEEIVLRNFFHVPNYEVNLLSVNRYVKFGDKQELCKNNVESWSTSRSY